MWLFERPIAHRGLHNDTMTENSMASFHNAIAKGYNIETDVHLLKSGEVVIFHDFTLKRLCGKDVKISDLTLDDIKSDTYLLPNGEHIPLFSELMEIAKDKTGILLELKFSGLNYRLERAVYKLIKGNEDYIAVQAFNPLTIIWFKHHLPEFFRGSLSGNEVTYLTKFFLKALKPNFIAYDVKHLDTATKILNKKGKYTLLAWTVRSEKDIANAIKYGASNIIFEDVDLDAVNFSLSSLKPVK